MPRGALLGNTLGDCSTQVQRTKRVDKFIIVCHLFIYCHIYPGVPHQCATLFSLGLLHYIHDNTNINQYTFRSNTVITWYMYMLTTRISNVCTSMIIRLFHPYHPVILKIEIRGFNYIPKTYGYYFRFILKAIFGQLEKHSCEVFCTKITLVLSAI